MSHQVPTQFDIALYVLGDLGELYEGTATGGSTTTLVDTELADVFPNELDLKNGTVFVLDTTDDAAPKGLMSKVASYDDDAGTITLDDTLAAAIGAGDKYAIADNRFMIESVTYSINRSLVKLGDIGQIDTSLTTSGSLTRYTMPSGVSERNLMRVFYRNSGTTDREEPTEILKWRPTPDGELVFHVAPPSGKVLELHWNGPHAKLEAATDALDMGVMLDRVVSEAVMVVIDRRLRQTDGEDRQLTRDWNSAREDLKVARARFPVFKVQPAGKPVMTEWGRRRKYGRRGRRSTKYGPWLK